MGSTLRRLPGLVAALGGGVAAVGLLWRATGEPVPVVTPRGQAAQLAGDGLYRFDTVFTAANNTAVDAVVLGLGIPLVLQAWLAHRHGSPRGTLLMTGSLGYLLYVYANYALGVAYNPLYLAYVTLLSASLFGFVAAFRAMNREALAGAAADPDVPHRTLSWFLLASAAVTAVVWLQPLVAALLQGTAPELLDVYTTTVTYSLDLAVITPAAALAGLLVRRRQPLGYLMAAPLLVTIVLLLPSIGLATALQIAAGISFTPAQVIGPIAGFGVLGALGTWLLVRLLRAVPAGASAPTAGPGRVVENHAVVDRDPAAVFAFMADPRREMDWNPQLLEVEQLTDGPIGVGSRFRMRFGHGAGDSTVTYTGFDPPRSWAAHSTSPRLDVHAEGRVEPAGSGARLVVRTDLRPQGPLRPLAPLLRRYMRRTWDRNLATIKARLEPAAEAPTIGPDVQGRRPVRHR